MLKVFGKVATALKAGRWVLLAVDTLQYFHDEAVKRGLTPGETPKIEIIERTENV